MAASTLTTSMRRITCGEKRSLPVSCWRDDGWLDDERWSLELRCAGPAGDAELAHLTVECGRLQSEQAGRSAGAVNAAAAALQRLDDRAALDVGQRRARQ